MSINKISLIGAGNIGGTLAHIAMLKNLGDIILFDIIPGLPQDKALDISYCKPIEGLDNRIYGTNDYHNIIDSDIVVVSAGISYKSGIDKNDLLEINSRIMLTVGNAIKEYCPASFIICVTSPSEIMIKILQEASGVQNNMIIGVAGILNSARFCMYLAWKFNISVNNIQTYIIGNDEFIVPVISMTMINGISLQTIINKKKLDKIELDNIIDKITNNEKVFSNSLKNKYSYYASATSVILAAQSYLLDQKKILSCTVKLKVGQYTTKRPLFLTVLAKIGSNGVEEIIEINLTKEEEVKIQKCINFVIKLNNITDRLLH